MRKAWLKVRQAQDTSDIGTDMETEVPPKVCSDRYHIGPPIVKSIESVLHRIRELKGMSRIFFN